MWMIGLSYNKRHHHLKGTSPVAQVRYSLGRELRYYSAQAAEGTSMTKGFSSLVALFSLATVREVGVSVGLFLILPSPPSESWPWAPGACCQWWNRLFGQQDP